ncbi:class I SAM-dependent methyltransferase [Streptomyces vinaceus]|uniref:Class I SAM-dependent methyltransferase n=2 Tax=Streptomyces TaxID=1883 RepID=A0A5J6JDG0_STRVI|nr:MULTISPECIES: class I SAM-dependent methyltransferase [Streptomyces]MCC0100395.1 class I SAM-dependent methyltransferase [Streptomyces flavotricini]QEV49337.1 class I SAM-dependent methyltransferase [Streptomyces vinaceus]GHE44541.1 methyltransferase [Streptomyces vinaceus]
MTDWKPETYGPRWKSVYDEIDWPQPEGAVDFLAKRVGGGRALELAIGTGRVALPLAQRGVPLDGLDASPEIVDVMRTKPGGESIEVSIGNIADFTSERRYSLIFLLLNSLYALQTQEEQIQCFESVAAHLEPGGLFVVETFVPDPTRFRFNGRAHVYDVGLDHVRIEADTFDRATQHIKENHVEIREEGIKLYPAFLRYTWPSELDLMARIAGLELSERWGDWGNVPYDTYSENHIGVYRKAG